jgi:hypothetical protein
MTLQGMKRITGNFKPAVETDFVDFVDPDKSGFA